MTPMYKYLPSFDKFSSTSRGDISFVGQINIAAFCSFVELNILQHNSLTWNALAAVKCYGILRSACPSDVLVQHISYLHCLALQYLTILVSETCL